MGEAAHDRRSRERRVGIAVGDAGGRRAGPRRMMPSGKEPAEISKCGSEPVRAPLARSTSKPRFICFFPRSGYPAERLPNSEAHHRT